MVFARRAKARFEEWLKQLACHGSVRVGRALAEREIRELLADLDRHASSRPTARMAARCISISRAAKSSGCSADEPAAGIRDGGEILPRRRADRISRLHRRADWVGKTALALIVAERLGAEIVNADSRQLYRGMDIGTAKPSAEERGRVPHHLIDMRPPERPLDVAEFVAMGRAAILDIARRGRKALVVGGSGFYLRALRGGIFSGPSASSEIRAELEEIAAERGIPFLHDELMPIDPPSASRIQRNDLYRIVRALEVHRMTGIPISIHQERHRFAEREYETLTIGARSSARDFTRDQ